jgi:hypothetical protein
VKDTSIWSGLDIQLSRSIATPVCMRLHGRALAGQLEIAGEGPESGGRLMGLLIALMIVVAVVAALSIAVLWTDLRE